MKAWWKVSVALVLSLAVIAPAIADDAKDADPATQPAETTFAPANAEEGWKQTDAFMRDQSNPLPANERLLKGIQMMDVVWEMPSDAELKKKMVWMRFSLRLTLANLGEKDSVDLLKEDLQKYAQHEDLAVKTEAVDGQLTLELLLARSLDADARTELLQQKQQEIEAMPVGPLSTRLATTLAKNLSIVSDKAVASKIADGLASHFAESSDEKAQAIAEELKGFSRRINLVGNPIRVVGKKLDGQDLDFASLKGKVVLVDFWATWCGPCIGEFPDLKKLYAAYHPHGFEVVGISLDDTKSIVDTFVSQRELPWIVVCNAEGDDYKGFRDENAVYYGINAIPQMILVDRNGIVLDTEARGEKLAELLAEMFPDVEAPNLKEAEKDSTP
ncbi:TlpA disulfide reductase family protein [Bremerella cremea]|uniref:TlpA family protein disulfide reductase n=1 Tax=Bremerella cremea TaxID=1031537 RepID=UPI0031F19A48